MIILPRALFIKFLTIYRKDFSHVKTHTIIEYTNLCPSVTLMSTKCLRRLNVLQIAAYFRIVYVFTTSILRYKNR